MNRVQELFLIILTLLAYSIIPTVSAQNAIDLAINPSGYTTESAVYAYSQYVNYMEDIGASPSDFMLVHDPIEVAELAYLKGDVLVFIEPKGPHLILNDQWKKDFLIEIENKYKLQVLAEDKKYKLLGMPFYTQNNRSDFIDYFNKKIGVQ